jgi:hypothetical protein
MLGSGTMVHCRISLQDQKHARYWALWLACLIWSGFAFAPCGRAQDSVGADSTTLFDKAASQFAIDDFDRDSRPDLASVQIGQSDTRNSLYRIDFHMTSGALYAVDIAAPNGGLQLESRDVNGDTYPDVVVTTYWTKQPVAILLNDGTGSFTRSEPSEFPNAFKNSESFLVSSFTTSKEPAALCWRTFSGDCASSEPSFAERLARERALPTLGCLCSCMEDGSVLGRAPPVSANHL